MGESCSYSDCADAPAGVTATVDPRSRHAENAQIPEVISLSSPRRVLLVTRSLVALAIGGAAVLVLYLSRDLIFKWDEWDFVLGRLDQGVESLLRPHNEHLVALPLVVFKILLGIFGLDSYVPFMTALVVCHGLVGWLIFEVVRRSAGDWAGLAAAVAILFLGSAWEDLLWAFQLGWIASSAFGLAALLLAGGRALSPARALGSGCAIALSLASSGIGLFFTLAVAVEAALTRGRRARVLIPVISALPYGLWLLLNRSALATHRDPLTLVGLISLPAYVSTGVASALSGLVGLDATYGPALLVAAAAGLAVVWLTRGEVAPRAVAALTALLSQFAIIGMVRSQFGAEQATASRYIYPAGVFIVIVIASLVGPAFLGRRALAVIALALAFAIPANTVQLGRHARELRAAAEVHRAELGAVELLRGSPAVDARVVADPTIFPYSVERYLAAVDRYGSIAPGLTLATLRGAPDPAREAVDRAVFRVVSPGLRIDSTAVDPRRSAATPICMAAGPTDVDPVSVAARSGSTIHFSSAANGPMRLGFAFVGDFKPENQLSHAARADEWYALPLPELAPEWMWMVRLEPATVGRGATLCVIPSS
jgi:hypothetical protein